MKYSASLDGLRAVAIVAVLAFHLAPGVVKGGFTGVDVFFVLSGYLITSVILLGLGQGRFSIREFYLRRVQRLLPNAAVMVMGTALLSLVFLLPSASTSVGAHGAWALGNLSNVYIVRNIGGYWGESASSAPLLHTWSLAVEEQFYLVLPLAVSLLWRRANILVVTAALTVCSLAVNAHGYLSHSESPFYLLPSRAWEPLIGASLAAFMIPAGAVRRGLAGPLAAITGWVGLAIIAAGYAFVPDSSRLAGFVALVPALGTLAVLASITDSSSGPARLLAKAPFVWIGKLSYSLYLWHWPLMTIGSAVFLLTGHTSRTGKLVGFVAAVAVSVAAYGLIEQPLRRRGPGRGLRLAAIGVLFCTALAACVVLSQRHSEPNDLRLFDQPAFYGRLYDVSPATIATTPPARFSDLLMPTKPLRINPPELGGIVHRWGASAPELVVLGSSHGTMYGHLIDGICRDLNVSVAFLTASGAGVFFPTPVGSAFATEASARSFDQARRHWIAEWRPSAVLVIDKWDSSAPDDHEVSERMNNLLAELLPHSRRVVVFTQPPVLRIGENVNLREYVGWYASRFGRLPRIDPDENERVRQRVASAIESIARPADARIRPLRIDGLFYKGDGSVRYADGRRFLYADDDHLSESGVEVARGLITDAIRDSVQSH